MEEVESASETGISSESSAEVPIAIAWQDPEEEVDAGSAGGLRGLREREGAVEAEARVCRLGDKGDDRGLMDLDDREPMDQTEGTRWEASRSGLAAGKTVCAAERGTGWAVAGPGGVAAVLGPSVGPGS